MLDRLLVVRCKECGEEHYSWQVIVENIEEDFQGCDVVTYNCPVTDKSTKSMVYRTA